MAITAWLAACSAQSDKPDIPTPGVTTNNPCAQMAPPTVSVPGGSQEFVGALRCSGDFPIADDLLAPKQIFTDPDLFTQEFVLRWQQYLGATGYGAVSGQPKQMSTALKLDKGVTSLPVLCEGYFGKKLPDIPIYCRVTALPSPSGVPLTGFIVLPIGYDDSIRQHVAQHGQRQALVSMGLQFGILFAQHIRNELQAAGVTLPTHDSTMVNACLAGISLRAVFPYKLAPTEQELMKAAEFAVSYLERQGVSASATRGYQGGQLFSCV